MHDQVLKRFPLKGGSEGWLWCGTRKSHPRAMAAIWSSWIP